MKKSMKVRLFSGLVALCMLLAFLPTAAFAAGNDVAQIGDQTYATLDDAIAAASDGDTILLLDDATVSKTLDKSITIDGQGHTIDLDRCALWLQQGPQPDVSKHDRPFRLYHRN